MFPNGQQGGGAPPAGQPAQQFAQPAALPQGANPLFAGGGVAGPVPQAAPVPASYIQPTPPGQQVPVPGQVVIPPAAPAPLPGPSQIEQEATRLRVELDRAQQQLAQMTPLLLQRHQQQPAAPAQQVPQVLPQSAYPQIAHPGLQPQQQPQAPQSPFDVPPFDQADMVYLTTDEQGNVLAKPGAPPFLVDRYIQHRNAMRNLGTQLPQILKGFDETVKQLKAENDNYRKNEATAKVRAEVDAMVAEVAPWAFVRDPSGKEVYDFDYATGQQVVRYTPLGAAYNDALGKAAQLGIDNPRARHEYAKNAVAVIQARIPNQGPAQQPQHPSLQQQFGQPNGQMFPAAQVPQYPQAQPQQYQQVFGQQPQGGLTQPGLNAFPRDVANQTHGAPGRRMSMMEMARQEAAKLGVVI